MRLSVFLGAAILAVAANPALAQTCVNWGEQVEISGILVEGLYPGAPEFQSVARGDAAIDALLLDLDTPLCVNANADLDAEALASTDLVQLACSEKRAARLQRGERITLTGMLFSAHTSYHVTPALLDCQ